MDTIEATSDESGTLDLVDALLAQWREQRPDLDCSPMGVIDRLNRVSALLLVAQERVFRDFGLDYPSFDVLATLRRTAGHQLAPGELAQYMMITPGAITHRLTKLEAAGLVERTLDRFDRRRVTVSLTDKGFKLVDEALVAHVDNERQLLAGFSTEEQGEFVRLLKHFMADLYANQPSAH
ncbi:MAG: MarR family transcriptional regulator [Coriobacteriales bacterium]|jgi:DNA-binding MarR family transcriptional regulator|nr:MarR family transcriptional regulator [Coriobacteriales bacterium]